jgi:hypothetical protein
MQRGLVAWSFESANELYSILETIRETSRPVALSFLYTLTRDVRIDALELETIYVVLSDTLLGIEAQMLDLPLAHMLAQIVCIGFGLGQDSTGRAVLSKVPRWVRSYTLPSGSLVAFLTELCAHLAKDANASCAIDLQDAIGSILVVYLDVSLPERPDFPTDWAQSPLSCGCSQCRWVSAFLEDLETSEAYFKVSIGRLATQLRGRDSTEMIPMFAQTDRNFGVKKTNGRLEDLDRVFRAQVRVAKALIIPLTKTIPLQNMVYEETAVAISQRLDVENVCKPPSKVRLTSNYPQPESSQEPAAIRATQDSLQAATQARKSVSSWVVTRTPLKVRANVQQKQSPPIAQVKRKAEFIDLTGDDEVLPKRVHVW